MIFPDTNLDAGHRLKQHWEHADVIRNMKSDFITTPVRAAVAALVCTIALLLPATLNAASDPAPDLSAEAMAKQRQLFGIARDALRLGKRSEVDKLLPRLKGYPLAPYLGYWDIRRRLPHVEPREIDRFLAANPDTLMSDKLRGEWLASLAEQGAWGSLIKYYQPSDDVRLECLYRRALYRAGRQKEAFEDMKKLWLHGKERPQECEPLFSAWRDAGQLSQTLVWDRIGLAMQGGEIYLARQLQRLLPNDDRPWVNLWLDVHANPDLILTEPRLASDQKLARAILMHGVRRMARSNSSQAAETWNRLVMKYSFSPRESAEMETRLAIALATDGAPEAMQWLKAQANTDDPAIHTWRIVTAINRKQWDDVAQWINQLPATERSEDRWRYWLGRAHEELGRSALARKTYAEIARNRSYYGFLAADRLDTPYSLVNKPLKYTAKELQEVEYLPVILRVREFRLLGDTANARREWQYAITHLNEDQILRAARLAHEWGWHDRAILALGKTSQQDDLEVRFPVLHQEAVTRYARNHNVDPSWAFAIIRQESAFATDARSPVGALGLMQVMPTTGKLIARQLDMRFDDPTNQLLDTNTNIRFGINYLRKVLDRFDQNPVLATAAYNAGDTRVGTWIPKDARLPPDQWIESVPYKETRDYLKRVLTYTVIYDQRLGRPITPLRNRMPEIGRGG